MSKEKKENAYSLLQQEIGGNKKIKKVVKSSKEVKAEKSKPDTNMSRKEVEPDDDDDYDDDPDIPDRSYGDFFCRLCDSHMNSENMWEAHITGKKHIKNVKKGDSETKYEDLDVDSEVIPVFRGVKDPVVGLSSIHELRRKEPGVPPMYTCFLCHASIATAPLVKEHVFTIKHRLNYIKEASPVDFELLTATNLKKASLEPLVIEKAAKLEEKYGRGTVQVRQEKGKLEIPIANKRRHDDSDDDMYRRPSKVPRNEINVWKDVNVPKYKMEVEDRRYDRKRDSYPDRRDYSPEGDLRRTLRRSPSPAYRSPSPPEFKFRKPGSSSRYEPGTSSRYEPGTSSRYEPGTSSRYEPGTSSRYEPDSHSRSDLDKYRGKSPSSSSYFRESGREVHEYSHHSTEPAAPLDSRRRTYDVPLPHEATSREDDNLKALYNQFLAITNLPSEIFLKLTLKKLESMERANMEEFTLLSKIILRAQAIMCTRLPADVQALINMNPQGGSEPPKRAISSSVPTYNLPPPVPEIRGANMHPHQANMSALPIPPRPSYQPSHTSPYLSGGNNFFQPQQNSSNVNPPLPGHVTQNHQPYNSYPSFSAYPQTGLNYRKY